MIQALCISSLHKVWNYWTKNPSLKSFPEIIEPLLLFNVAP